MNIIERVENVFLRKCNVCRRPKHRAVGEQVQKLSACGVEQCPFHEDIYSAIREAQSPELLSFYLSKDEALEGTYITVFWETNNCRSVSITNYGEVELSGHRRILARKGTKEVELILEDLFGELFSKKLPLKVFPKPTFEILDVKNRVEEGESFFIRYKSENFKSIYLKDEGGGAIADLSFTNSYLSPILTKDQKFLIEVEGRFGGQFQQQIEVSVFPPAIVNRFNCDNLEKVDTMPISFEFEFQNVSKAELFLNDSIIADVTKLKSYTHISENKTENVLSLKYELVLTGLTGKVLKKDLASKVSVYPQPQILELSVSPDSIILYPKEITLFNRSIFCEKIIFHDGKTEKIIQSDAMVILNPAESRTYSFTPIGKQNFYGKPKDIFIEVFHPIELKASKSKEITLPNIPVNITWQSKNHTQIFIEPGGIDVTHKTSYDIKIESKTTVKVVAINKKHRQESLLFIDVLQYQRANKEILRRVPELNMYVPKLDAVVPKMSKEIQQEHKSINSIMPTNISVNVLQPLRNIIPKIDFSFQRMWRDRLFEELKFNSKKQKT